MRQTHSKGCFFTQTGRVLQGFLEGFPCDVARDPTEVTDRRRNNASGYIARAIAAEDFNGNNVVSLAEIDKMAVEQFPLLNHKPALMRAYKASFGDEGDEFIHKREFKILLANLFYFNKLFWLFDQVDQRGGKPQSQVLVLWPNGRFNQTDTSFCDF